MASKAHGFFCFEVLAASFDKHKHPDLSDILDLYKSYQREIEGVEPDPASEEVNGEIQENIVEDDSSERNEGLEQRVQLQLPSISRLRDLTPSSRSTISTPSSMSVNSSRTQLTSNTSDSDGPLSYASRLSVTESYPMFVTWNTLSRSGHKSLRGCIGTFEALPLERGLETYALTSAFEDTRFSPIPSHSLQSLSCSLTLLADFEECDGPMDWELGKHGIRISFMNRYRKHGATYLPDVAIEQGWTKEETLDSLMRKAGWEPPSRKLLRGSSKPWDDVRDFRVVRYTGLKASATYQDWQEFQTWAKSKKPDLWM